MNQTKKTSPSKRPAAKLMAAILAYAENRVTQKITLRELAQHCGVSVSTITQTFQKEMGISFHRYLTDRRMELAKELIGGGTPLEEVGRQVGYTDHSSFYRAFHQSTGVSPREYKRVLLRK
ncbi:MAG: helix-turn-helix transcriptional regulator [Oscillospiraceae bacterium]|nr:helix-turn-helix transcriptional regulator [Oscillospiraceae bacterium]